MGTTTYKKTHSLAKKKVILKPEEKDNDTELEAQDVQPSAQTKFVLSTIAYVPEREFDDDSSDDDIDDTFPEEYFTSPPYTTVRPKHARSPTKLVKVVSV